MRAGTWDPDAPTDPVGAINARQASRAAALTSSQAKASVAAARVRARAAWTALSELTPDAWSWFEESGPNHYAKHVHDLSAWLDGVRSDPDVGAMLQDDAEGWVAFGALIDAADPTVRDDEGWSVGDICFHVAMWFERGAECVEHDAGWGRRGRPTPTCPPRRSTQVSSPVAAGDARGGAGALNDARDRLRAAFTGRSVATDAIKDVFRECTVDHYAEHMPMLRRLTGSGGSVP
jgi:hypothetical protein